MLKKIPLILLAAMAFTACDKKNVAAKKCGDQFCTDNFATVTISVLNADNSPALIKHGSYSVINQRTKDTVYYPPAVDYQFNPGTQFVIADNSVKALSETGDDIKVTATDSLTNQTKSAVIKVSGGECACHIQKISGPDTLKFD